MDSTLNAIVNVNKPAGVSSARVVARIKHLLPKGTKVGHAGTLDPFATGVLLILIGKATKRCEELMGQPKRYLATVKLGVTTPTLDPTSEETVFPDVTPVARDAMDIAATKFVGNIEQMPPAFSALKVGGQRAYDLARRGEAVALSPRIVRIDSMTVIDFAWPFVTIDVACGRGTYIRSIARDLGQALGVGGGYLTALQRTRVGDFDVSNAVAPAALNCAADVISRSSHFETASG